MDKLKKIRELLDGKGTILVRNEGSEMWYVHCWDDATYKDYFNQYVDEIDVTLDKIIEKLGGKQ